MNLTCYTHGVRTRPVVGLSFDDGPNPPVTDDVRAILRHARAKATFFVIGRWVQRWPSALRRVVAEGHTVGNHTQLHQWGLGDYDAAAPVIASLLGRPTRFARAPAFDYASCSESELVRSGELTLIDADVNPSDWDCDDAAEIARRVLQHPSLGPGSIIDLHDGYDKYDSLRRLSRPAAMLEALPAILIGLEQRGLKPVGLDEFTFGEPVDVEQLTRTRTRGRARQVAQQ